MKRIFSYDNIESYRIKGMKAQKTSTRFHYFNSYPHNRTADTTLISSSLFYSSNFKTGQP